MAYYTYQPVSSESLIFFFFSFREDGHLTHPAPLRASVLVGSMTCENGNMTAEHANADWIFQGLRLPSQLSVAQASAEVDYSSAVYTYSAFAEV